MSKIVKNPGMCLKVKAKYSEYNHYCENNGVVTIFHSNENDMRDIERNGVITNEPIETNYFFNDHYMKIYKQTLIRRNDKIENHPYIGKKLVYFDDNVDSKERIIESVHKHNSMGNYLYLLYYTLTDSGNRSHGGIMYENIDCHNPHILEEIEINKKEAKLV